MGLRSMTGFGREEIEREGWRATVDVDSVNKDGMRVRIRAPEGFAPIENDIRGRITERLARGRIEVRIDVALLPGESEGVAGVIDRAAFAAVAAELDELSDHLDLGAVDLGDVLEFRDEFERGTAVSLERLEGPLLEAVGTAVDHLVAERDREGEALEADLRAHLDELRSELSSFREALPSERASLRSRLTERVEEAMREYDGEEPRETRLAREIVYHADRADVSEELDRAEAHAEKLGALMEGAESGEPIGKELDFYLQELVRETNTLSAKAHSASLTDSAITMKSTVERMREQAANVE